MFTGIVEELGAVLSVGTRLVLKASKVAVDSGPGASLAVGGVCLTVVERQGDQLAFDVSEETLSRSALGQLRPGDTVNLERPVTLVTRLGGHLVQGHVDGVGRIQAIEETPTGRTIQVSVPDGLTRYVVEKGSVAVDGVSLTVTHMVEGRFGVALIPYTLEATTLGRTQVGDRVNLEVDVMAKYVEALTREGRRM